MIGITGASGAIYGNRLLEVLKEKGIEIHLIVSRTAEEVLKDELGIDADQLRPLVAKLYSDNDMTASVTSGSFLTDGMVIVPCSMKTMAGIALGFTDNVILRAADVALKERRRLILVPRETPLNPIHIENMLKLANLGAVILPAMPGFYHRPDSIKDLVDFIVGKILDNLRIEHNLYRRWGRGT